MKPLNGSKNTGVTLSSDLVSWQGPDIPCIKLCKGQSITVVVYQLAMKLCNLLDSLNVSNYDLTCLEVGNCPPKTFDELIQLLIQSICEIQLLQGPPGTNGNYVTAENIPPGDDCSNGGVVITTYSGTTGEPLETYTVCNGTNGTNGLPGIPGQCNCLPTAFMGSWAGDVPISGNSAWVGGAFTGFDANMEYTVDQGAGTYKFSFEILADLETASARVSISIDGNDPSFSPGELFKYSDLTSLGAIECYFSLVDDQVVVPRFIGSSALSQINYNAVKLVVTKID